MNRASFVGLLLAAALILGLAVAVWPHTEHPDSPLGLREPGVIRIGYAIEAPYAYLRANGDVTGESPEVARRIVARLGIPHIEWRLAEFSELISDLEDGRIDVIAAGLFITPERAHRIAFSELTFHVREGLLVNPGNPHALHSYADAVHNRLVKIAVLSGSIEEAQLAALVRDPAQLTHVPDARTGRIAVETGAVQGFALSLPSLRWLALQHELGHTEIAAPFTQPDIPQGRIGYGAFAFRKDDTHLQAAWNAAQAGYVGSLEHRTLVSAFGFDDGELPGTVRTREVLAR
ncbi:MAG: transporter substrate-binding domain-containing protein [Rhodocyclaceae bacterium]|nr:MAG: transporter substrate-binding domain-containing protein [Rhodocyclaceae bacterium]